MKIFPIREAYLNTSGRIYDSEFLNLVNIKDDKIDFDDRTFFLNEEEKSKLNKEPIKPYHNIVVISEKNGVYGLIADIDIQEYQQQRIKSHELVLPDTIQGMLANYQTYNTEVAPTFLVHREVINLRNIVESLEYDDLYTLENRNLYIYGGEKANYILGLYEQMNVIYIGDGHHRLYTTSVGQIKKTVLAYLIDFESVDILPIHRLLKNVTPEMFEYAKNFMQQKLGFVDEKYLQKGVVKVSYRDEEFYVQLMNIQDDIFWNQDVLRLNTQIFTSAFRQYKNEDLKYVSDEELLTIKQNLEENDVLLELYGVTKDEFMEFANNNYIMAPKSTWFKEKFPSFLIMKKYK